MAEETRSARYDDILKWYLYGFWSIQHLRLAVQRKWITENEFVEITGAIY